MLVALLVAHIWHVCRDVCHSTNMPQFVLPVVHAPAMSQFDCNVAPLHCFVKISMTPCKVL